MCISSTYLLGCRILEWNIRVRMIEKTRFSSVLEFEFSEKSRFSKIFSKNIGIRNHSSIPNFCESISIVHTKESFKVHTHAATATRGKWDDDHLRDIRWRGRVNIAIGPTVSLGNLPGGVRCRSMIWRPRFQLLFIFRSLYAFLRRRRRSSEVSNYIYSFIHVYVRWCMCSGSVNFFLKDRRSPDHVQSDTCFVSEREVPSWEVHDIWDDQCVAARGNTIIIRRYQKTTPSSDGAYYQRFTVSATHHLHS